MAIKGDKMIAKAKNVVFLCPKNRWKDLSSLQPLEKMLNNSFSFCTGQTAPHHQ